MSARKRAGLYLIRKKGRTLLMLCLLFLMSISVLVGISFKESTEKELERLRLSMASGFILEVNQENEMYREVVDLGQGASATRYVGPLIMDETVEKILAIDGVEDYTVEKVHVAWTDLALRPGLCANMEIDPDPDPSELIPYTEDYVSMCRHTTDLYACRNGEHHKNFRTGALAITEGRNLEETDRFKAVISDWLAENNHLSVGDAVTLETKEGNYGFSKEPLKTWGEPVKAEIVGLFHVNFSQAQSDSTFESCYFENVIYVDENTYTKMQDNLKDHAGYGDVQDLYGKHATVEFLVNDPAQIDSIIQQIKSRKDFDLTNMDLKVDNTAYEASAKPYRQIRFFSMLLLAFGLCGIGIILYLALKIWTQGRMLEIGILRSIGMKKKEILGQMLMECFAVAAVALVLAFLLSGWTAGECADAAKRLTAPREGKEAYIVKVDQYFMPQITKTSSDEVVLERTASPKAFGFSALFVCGISGISVILSFSKISGMEPKKLLQSI